MKQAWQALIDSQRPAASDGELTSVDNRIDAAHRQRDAARRVRQPAAISLLPGGNVNDLPASVK